jgi:hypothetical protein
VVLDAGAVQKLTGEGKSLLPIGVTDVKGEFGRGAVITCVNSDGVPVARGLSNYTSAETRRIMRKPSSEIESILGFVEGQELIHRDNLVLVKRCRCGRLAAVVAQVDLHAVPAFRLARLAGVAAVQDQPVVGVEQEFFRHEFQQLLLDDVDVLARRQAGAVGDAEDVRVHRHGRLAERGVQHHVGGLAAHARQGFQRFAVFRHFAAMQLDQHLAGRDHVLGLGLVQADGLDVVFNSSSPRSRIACGVFATGYSLRVALLTPTSVACADSSTAISSSNGVVYSSSVTGFGLAARKRSNIS